MSGGHPGGTPSPGGGAPGIAPSPDPDPDPGGDGGRRRPRRGRGAWPGQGGQEGVNGQRVFERDPKNAGSGEFPLSEFGCQRGAPPGSCRGLGIGGKRDPADRSPVTPFVCLFVGFCLLGLGLFVSFFLCF